MNILAKKTTIGLIQLILGLMVMLFGPAWTFDFWQAWVYVFVFGVSVTLIFVYLYKHDQKLLERRLVRTEKEKSQKWIQFSIYLSYICIFILPSIDHRMRWSNIPFTIVLAGDVLVAIGNFIILMTLKENSFAGTTIELTADQKVISTGVYSIIRHPMYFGAIVLLLGTPFALGSWWGLLFFVLITIGLILRLLDEERFLSQGLLGYIEYCQKTRYRLIPYLW